MMKQSLLVKNSIKTDLVYHGNRLLKCLFKFMVVVSALIETRQVNSKINYRQPDLNQRGNNNDNNR